MATLTDAQKQMYIDGISEGVKRGDGIDFSGDESPEELQRKIDQVKRAFGASGI